MSSRPLPSQKATFESTRSYNCGPNEWPDLALGALRHRRNRERRQVCSFHLFRQGWLDEWVGGIKNSAIFEFFHGRQLKRLCLVEQAAVCDGLGGKWNKPARSGIVPCAACSVLAKRPSGTVPVEPRHILQTCPETSSSLAWKTTLTLLVLFLCSFGLEVSLSFVLAKMS